MAYEKRSYVEHVAIRVKDIHWHVRFFREALGMTVRAVEGPPDSPKQLWTVGGVQLVSDPGFEGGEGRLAHLGVMTEDLDAAIAQACAWEGVRAMPQGRNWLRLPDGLCVELLQPTNDAVARALSIDPRA
jgi:hypothetical protein